MKNKEIYKTALNLIGEPMDEERVADYNMRAPYLIGNFLCENARLDAAYRSFMKLEPIEYTHSVCAELEEDFGLSERFAPAAGYYLASMLVMDEDGELADKMFDLYSTAMSKISSEIPGVSEKIIDFYR